MYIFVAMIIFSITPQPFIINGPRFATEHECEEKGEIFSSVLAQHFAKLEGTKVLSRCELTGSHDV